ncbi:PucR family transcriptional regulator [Nocardia fluminea]|uniref:PucR family transcriptional regulator n=1 Tax=Nocardia fluminea TaxID=134984 RepID=UPI0033C311F2
MHSGDGLFDRRLSDRAREVIRQGAEVALNAPEEWLDELYDATLLKTSLRAIAGDPLLAEAVRRVNRGNLLHWASANVADPGMPVPINLGADQIAIVRDLVRRGMNEAALQAYRVGQDVVWRRWMTIVFILTPDPFELQEVLEVTAASIARFVDGTIEAITEVIGQERDELARGSYAERREVISLILEGEPTNIERASTRLGYRLDATHTAAIAWSDIPGAELDEPHRVTRALTRAAGAATALSVLASAATLWVWVPGPTPPDTAALSDALDHIPGVRIAIGSTGRDLAGFRTSHLDAQAAHRILARPHSTRRLVTFGEVQLTSLITENGAQADRFIKYTLGDLEHADSELRESVLVYINEQCNATRAAARLFTHRNTILRRIARADELLPRPLAENGVHVAVALDALYWRQNTARLS